ncbi:glycosyltransferase family 2 protein [Geodermatophilus sp. SYSU D00700]
MNSGVQAVVLNWRDTERTLRCVTALQRCAHIDRVVLVDNETERDPELLRLGTSPSVTVVCNEANLGFAGGVNVGIAEARAGGAQHILLINNDAQVDDEAVRIMMAVLDADPGLAAVAPLITFPDGTVQAFGGGCTRPLLGDAPVVRDLDRPVDYLTGAISLYRDSALLAAGDFDERFFMYWEDVDLGLRLREAGWRLAVADEAVATHELSASRGRAGTRLITYYWTSLLLFTIKWGGLWWFGTGFRLLIALVTRVLGIRPRSELAAIARGIRQGLARRRA